MFLLEEDSVLSAHRQYLLRHQKFHHKIIIIITTTTPKTVPLLVLHLNTTAHRFKYFAKNGSNINSRSIQAETGLFWFVPSTKPQDSHSVLSELFAQVQPSSHSRSTIH